MSSSSKKVAFFVPSLRGGGAEKVTVTLANEFVKRGLQVDLLLAQAEGPFLSEVSKSVRVMDLKSSRVATCIPKLVRYLRNERPCVLISAMSYANIAAIIAKLIAGAQLRLVVGEHIRLKAERDASLRHKLMVAMVGWAYHLADAVVAVSQGVASELTNAGVPKSKIHVIYNPVVSDQLFVRAREACENPWFKPGQLPVILAVGRLEPQKDFATLIYAFALVRKQHSVRLVILGEGSMKSALTKLVADLGLSGDVQLMGFADNPYAFMSRAAVFALSSTHEGLGNVLIEALACGLPVVSTDCPHGPAEILENGKWGRLVSPGDARELANALRESLAKTVDSHSSQRAEAFTVHNATEKYLALIS